MLSGTKSNLTLLPHIILLVISLTIAPQVVSKEEGVHHIPVKGKDFIQLDKPVDISTSEPQKEKVRISEFFLFKCGHCYQFNSHLTNWKKTLPSWVKVYQIPVFYNETTKAQARLFYALEKLGISSKAFPVIFKAIHEHEPSLDDKSKMGLYIKKHFSISKERFEKAFTSEKVTKKIDDSLELIKAIQLKAVPTLLINGEYMVNPEMSGGYKKMLKTARLLIKQSANKKSSSEKQKDH